jgi:hypothetical protein
MDVLVRPETDAADTELGLRTVLRGEEAEGFLELLERSKAENPAKKAYLEEAVAFSHKMLVTGRLPD